MIRFFERNMTLQVVLILAVLLLLWVPSMVHPPAIVTSSETGILYELVLRWLSPAPLWAVVVAMLLVVAEGFNLNLLLSNVGLVSQKSLMPTLLYILAMSSMATTLTPIVIVNALLVPCINQLVLRGTLLTIPTNRICGTTVLIGISTMFYLPAIAIMCSYLLMAISYRLYSWKDWVVMLLGLLAPYFILVTVLFMNDMLVEEWLIWIERLGGATFRVGESTLLQALAIGFLAALFVVSLLALWSRLGEHPIVWQKNASAVMLMTVGGLIMLFYSQFFPVDMQLFAIPFAFCCTLFLTREGKGATRGKKKSYDWVYDVLWILVLISVIVCGRC